MLWNQLCSTVSSIWQVIVKSITSLSGSSLHVSQAVPFSHGDLAINQDLVGIVDDTVHNRFGNGAAVTRVGINTMKKEELYRIDYQSEAQFRQRVDAYVFFFNHVRPHMSLNYKTPDQVEANFMAGAISGNATLLGSDPDNF